MAQKTIAQQAVAIFMSGSIAEAKQILEIGIAIVEQRAAAPGMPVAATAQRRKPGPRPQTLPPAAPAPVSNAAPPDPAAPVRRRPGRPAGSGKASGPVGVVAPPAAASDAATAPVTRRRGRPPVVASPEEQVEPGPVAAAAVATGVLATPAGFNELPPQGEPDDQDE